MTCLSERLGGYTGYMPDVCGRNDALHPESVRPR